MPINLIPGLLFMEKNMEQIYRKKFPNGSHTVYCQYGGMGDLTLSSFHYGSDVEDYWGNDEYEYYGLTPEQIQICKEAKSINKIKYEL